jgi:glycosyltransferase involved in cell wall biosynthesis
VNGEFVIDGENWRTADIVIVARGFPTGDTIDLVRKIKRAGKYLVYETDDAIPLIPEHHQKPWYKEAAPYVYECARLASAVTVSTRPLAQVFETQNEKVEVIENQLDPRIWKPQLHRDESRSDGQIRIGIVGSKHHEKDFEVLRDAMGAIAEKNDTVLWVVYGDGASSLVKTLPAARCQYVAPNYNYEGHPERLAGLGLDIGLCPLFDDDFNRCKSDIKYLEFGFLGICGIYSKLPPYESSVSHDINGLLCEWSEDAWLEKIQTLIADQALRDRLSGRACVDVQNRILNHDNNRWNDVLAEFM